MTLLTLSSMGKTFANGTQALAQLDLTVRQGEFISLLGPSGCGKSTALRMIAGLERADQGALTWGAQRPDLGFVFQDATLMPWADVFDNVFLPLRLQGQSRAQAKPRIMDALTRVGLANFAAHMPRELSGGMKMRASIARALVTEPKLLLMDEIFVTHSVYESAFLSSRICVFTPRPGRIVETIDVAPITPRTEDFRLSSIYLEACAKASRALASAMESVMEST